MKYNQQTLQKLEKMVAEAKYILRYERGSFQSGYCILENKKVVVLNKFLPTEGRVGTLIELIPELQINIDLLTHEAQLLYEKLLALAEKPDEDHTATDAEQIQGND